LPLRSQPSVPAHDAQSRTHCTALGTEASSRHGLAAAAAHLLFTVEVLTVAGLVRYVVLFVMKLKTRRVEVARISSQPDGSWMTQVARNLTDADDGFLRAMEYLRLTFIL
jgi:hypothetical protein